MKIRTLEMKGIRHFSQKKIEFTDGLNIVYGPNESGKSTVLDSLLASVLKPTSRDVHSLRQWGAPYSEIKLTYATDSGTYTITRVLHPVVRDRLVGEELVLEDPDEIEDTLEAQIGFADRALFENSTVVRQNDMQILQEERSRAKIRNRVRSLMSGVPERSTDEALEILETSIFSAESFLEETEQRVKTIEEELQQYQGNDEVKSLEAKLQVYEGDLQRDQAQLSGYEVLLEYREKERDYNNYSKTLEHVENLEAYMRRLPVREKELIQQLQEELNRISAMQDKLIDKKRETRIELRGIKEKLSAIDDELEGVGMEKEGFLSRLTLLGKSARARKEELANKRVEISQNAARLEDLLDRYEEQIKEWRKKFQEKGERLQSFIKKCGEYENWPAEMLETRRKEYESRIEETLRGMTGEELEQNVEAARKEADMLRAELVRTNPDLKDKKDIERITIEKEKLAEITVEWKEKIAGLKAQIELLSSKTEKRETLTRELEMLQKERKEKTLIMKADKIAHDVITLVYEDLKEIFAPELEIRAEALLKRITQGRYKEVIVRKEDLRVLVLPPEKSDPVEVDVLSQGTKDQLYLSLRIALSELLSGDKNPPLLFDEAFYTFDEDRLKEALAVLREIGQTTQVVVFTHEKSYAEYGNGIPLKKR